MLARNTSMFASARGLDAGSPAALAQVSDDVVKIGVLTDMNGPASTPTGQGSVTAAQMAVDDFGGKVLGKPITRDCRRPSIESRISAPASRGAGTTPNRST